MFVILGIVAILSPEYFDGNGSILRTGKPSKAGHGYNYPVGDGFTNMITQTSGALIGAMGLAKIFYNKWVKWVTHFMIILIILDWLMLIPTVTMPLDGF